MVCVTVSSSYEGDDAWCYVVVSKVNNGVVR